MKTFLKKIVVFIGIIVAISVAYNSLNSAPTYAESFLGMPAWNDGVELSQDKNEDAIVSDIATIATNILSDVTIIASYLVIGFVIYGGYLYMSSSGDPVKAAQAKKTLINAFIGLAIAMSAFVIFGTIRIALIGDKSIGDCAIGKCLDGGIIVTNLINQVVGMAGAVAVIFLVVGAWGYMTAAGDPNKLQKAKNTILYSIIGLAIVALALTITAFVSKLIRESNGGTPEPESYIKNTSVVIEIANLNKEE